MSDVKKKLFANSIWIKIWLIVFICLILLIPVGQVEDLIHERHHFSNQAKDEVTNKWSRKQSTGRVVLSVPIIQTRTRLDKEGKSETYDHHNYVNFLPDTLQITADTQSHVKKRGLYTIPLYETRLILEGDFSNLEQYTQELKNTKIFWKKAELNLGVDEVRGLKEVEVQWNGSKLERTIGNMASGVCGSAIRSKIPGSSDFAKQKGGKFHITVGLKGSDALEFLPFGGTTKVKMISNWPDPSFDGSFLPDNSAISKNGFQAEWSVLGLNRNLPKSFTGRRSLKNLQQESRFGVRFLMPLQNYQLNTRSVKYSFLFVALTFATMFFIEILYGLKFHPMHYTITGTGLCLFYLLLISVSEHIGFALAYAGASGATILTIFLYVLGVTHVKKGAFIVLMQLSVLYGFLFVLLKQEDFALVVGSVGLWFVLAFIMYVTRHIDWFNIQLPESGKPDRNLAAG